MIHKGRDCIVKWDGEGEMGDGGEGEKGRKALHGGGEGVGEGRGEEEGMEEKGSGRSGRWSRWGRIRGKEREVKGKRRDEDKGSKRKWRRRGKLV